MKQLWLRGSILVMCLVGCSDDGTTHEESDASTLGLPTTAADVEMLIASRDYRDWICEAQPRAMRGPSPHGAVIVCSNRVLSTYISETDDWLRGSAAIKELYANETDTEPSGYSYYAKVADASAAGAGWYWYERRGSTVTADGLGGDNSAVNGCVSCHAAAGSDASHTTVVGSRDFVYTAIAR